MHARMCQTVYRKMRAIVAKTGSQKTYPKHAAQHIQRNIVSVPKGCSKTVPKWYPKRPPEWYPKRRGNNVKMIQKQYPKRDTKQGFRELQEHENIMKHC